MLLDVTQEDFEQKVLKSNVPVLVDIYQKNCCPCDKVTNEVYSLDAKLPCSTAIVKIDYDGINFNKKERTALNNFVVSLKRAAKHEKCEFKMPILAFVQNGEIISVEFNLRTMMNAHSIQDFVYKSISIEEEFIPPMTTLYEDGDGYSIGI